jgi:hypothetical protein
MKKIILILAMLSVGCGSTTTTTETPEQECDAEKAIKWKLVHVGEIAGWECIQQMMVEDYSAGLKCTSTEESSKKGDACVVHRAETCVHAKYGATITNNETTTYWPDARDYEMLTTVQCQVYSIFCHPCQASEYNEYARVDE